MAGSSDSPPASIPWMPMLQRPSDCHTASGRPCPSLFLFLSTDSGKRKTRVSQNSGLPTFFDERVLDFDGLVFVGCLQFEAELVSNLRLALVSFTVTPSGQPESPVP
eukprot:7560995-Pyramimonas_sp.AAC.1